MLYSEKYRRFDLDSFGVIDENFQTSTEHYSEVIPRMPWVIGSPLNNEGFHSIIKAIENELRSKGFYPAGHTCTSLYNEYFLNSFNNRVKLTNELIAEAKKNPILEEMGRHCYEKCLNDVDALLVQGINFQTPKTHLDSILNNESHIVKSIGRKALVVFDQPGVVNCIILGADSKHISDKEFLCTIFTSPSMEYSDRLRFTNDRIQTYVRGSDKNDQWATEIRAIPLTFENLRRLYVYCFATTVSEVFPEYTAGFNCSYCSKAMADAYNNTSEDDFKYFQGPWKVAETTSNAAVCCNTVSSNSNEVRTKTNNERIAAERAEYEKSCKEQGTSKPSLFGKQRKLRENK